MSPETFTLAIIGAIASGLTAIVVGVVGLVVNRRTDKKADDIQNTTVDKTDKMLTMIQSLAGDVRKSLERENNDLRSTVSNQGKQLTAVLESQNHIIKDAAAVKEARAGLRKDVEAAKQTISELQEESRVTRAELTLQKKYAEKLEGELDKAKTAYELTIQTTTNQLNEAKSELDRVKQENAELKVQAKKVDELTERVETLEGKVAIMTAEREQMVSRINELVEQRDAAKAALERLQQSTEKLDTQDLTELVAKPPASVEMPKLTEITPDAT